MPQSRLAGGTSLGLAIVRAIIHSHNGRIGLSASARGTAFAVTLPAAAHAITAH
ncbi:MULTISPECIES: ATP-binding protein [Mycolicibacterium]|uniref:ATP-binding protein n=1 Tax=Mycolicibacterium TaxID=1866885 RepID=UPI000AF5BA0B